MPEEGARLLSLVRRGHTDAYAGLWTRHHPMALRIARRIDPYGDPEDPVSDAFTAVYAIIHTGEDRITAFRPYLASAVHHHAIRHSQARTAVQLGIELDDLPDDKTPIEAAIERLAVHETLNQLTPAYRKILTLTLLEGHTVDSAAKLLGISYNATAILAMRARNRFRTLWDTHPTPNLK